MRARFVVLAILSALPLTAQTMHPFNFEDMMALKRVEEPVPSPGGKWVLFGAVDVDLKANTKTPHVWVVPLTGGKEQEIISDQDADRPRWAPDGKRFAFVSTKEGGSQIWIADFDGARGTVTAKHRLTNIATEADGELWSPDGKNILFKSEVYPECVGAEGEEAGCNGRRVDQAKNSKVKAQIFTHLLYRHWNSYKEGKRTHLFVVCVAPTCGCGSGIGGIGVATDDLGPDALVRADEQRSPETAKLRSAGRVGAPAPTQAQDGEGLCSDARDLTPGDYDAPVFSVGGQDNYALSPDGKELCYAANHDAMPAASTNNDLFTVPVDWPADATSAQVIAATKDITADNKAADNTPLYSPDGTLIAYRAQARPGYESDRWRLRLYVRDTGAKYDRTEEFDHWVGTFAWAPDSKTIYFIAEHKGQSRIYAQLRSFGKSTNVLPRRTLVAGYNDDLATTPDGKTLLFTRMSISAPNEIYASSAEGDGCWAPNGIWEPGASTPCSLNEAWAITHINAPLLSQVEMARLETFFFTGAADKNVQGFLVKPPNFDPSKKYPVKFLIHGGPEGAWGDDWSYRWNPELFAAPTSSGPGYVVIMINFHGSTGYGQKFIDATNGDWGGAPFEDLMKGLDYAEQHYPFIDKNRECALGASYGGYMANWILGHTDRFKCIVSHDGMFNSESAWGSTEELWFNEWEFKGTPYTNREMYRKWSPHLSATNFKTPTLVIHSQLDYRLDVSEGFQLFTTLQRQGVPSKMLYFPDEGHWVLKPQNSQLWYKTVNDWVDQWVGKSR